MDGSCGFRTLGEGLVHLALRHLSRALEHLSNTRSFKVCLAGREGGLVKGGKIEGRKQEGETGQTRVGEWVSDRKSSDLLQLVSSCCRSNARDCSSGPMLLYNVVRTA